MTPGSSNAFQPLPRHAVTRKSRRGVWFALKTGIWSLAMATLLAGIGVKHIASASRFVGEDTLLVERDKLSPFGQRFFDSVTTPSIHPNRKFEWAELTKRRQEFSKLKERMEACRKTPAAFSQRFQNWVRFVDMASAYENPAIKPMLVAGYINTSINYDKAKAAKPSQYLQHYGFWSDDFVNTIDRGAGVCVDFELAFETTARLVMGDKAFEASKPSATYLYQGDKKWGLPSLQKAHERHVVLSLTLRPDGQTEESYLLTNSLSRPATEREADFTAWARAFHDNCIIQSERAYISSGNQDSQKTYEEDYRIFLDGQVLRSWEQRTPLFNAFRIRFITHRSSAPSAKEPTVPSSLQTYPSAFFRTAEDWARYNAILKLAIQSNPTFAQATRFQPRPDRGLARRAFQELAAR